jgi:Thioredoxin-like
MEISAYYSRVIWSLGWFLLFSMPAVVLPQDQGKFDADEPKKPALYDPKADARARIKAASAKAKHDHSRVLVMFGFEGCSWCHKLHALFEQNPEIRKLLRDEYVKVLVDIEARSFMVSLGVQVFIFETESAGWTGDSPQVLAGRARKRKRPEISLRALCVNWIGAFSSLPFGKLPEGDSNF